MTELERKAELLAKYRRLGQKKFWEEEDTQIVAWEAVRRIKMPLFLLMRKEESLKRAGFNSFTEYLRHELKKFPLVLSVSEEKQIEILLERIKEEESNPLNKYNLEIQTRLNTN